MANVAQDASEIPMSTVADAKKETGNFPMSIECICSLPSLSIEPPIRGIYFLLMRGEVVYIGQTHHLAQRIIGHRDRGAFHFDEVRYLQMDSGNMNRVEREMIARFRPAFNSKRLWKDLSDRWRSKNPMGATIGAGARSRNYESRDEAT